VTPPVLPRSWRWAKVQDIGEVQLGRQRAPRYHQGNNMRPYLRVANVFEDRIDTQDIKFMHFEPEEFERYKLQNDDILLNEGQSPQFLGRPAIYRGNPPETAFTNSLIRFRGTPGEIEPRWALAVFRHHLHSGRFARESRITTNIAHLSASRFKEIEFPVPPLAEQRRIVDILEDHLSRLDAANASALAADRRISPLVTSILQENISLRDQPDWKFVMVAQAGTVDLGRQRHPDWHTGPEMRPYLRVANVFEDRIDTSDLMEMDFSEGAFERYRLHPGDVLLNEGQSPEFLGRPAIYRGNPVDIAFTNTLLRFRPSPGVTPEWALLVFRRHMRSGRFRRESRITTNIAHLSSARFKAVEFPVPPLGVQIRIVAAVEALITAAEASRSATEVARNRSHMLRRAILAAAFSGQLTGRASDLDRVGEMAGV
jgi:type I restriction enzyme, S subunit